jgi:DNA modification methylase
MKRTPQFQVLTGKCEEVLKAYPDNYFDSVVCDPPYGFAFMGKKWDYDVPIVKQWEEILRVLKPGGHLLAFAGTRTQHRMAVRIEDAGFEIRDMIMWVYGSGFPKSLDVSKAIDKAAGAEREVVGKRQPFGREGRKKYTAMTGTTYGGFPNVDEGGITVTAPATEAACQWEGWGTALKPAVEPITVARKPFRGTVAQNVLEWGTGGVNIDGCRVGTDEIKEKTSIMPERKSAGIYGDFGETKRFNGNGTSNPSGRFPANFIHDGSEEVVGLFPETKSGGADGNRRGHGPSHGDVCYGEYKGLNTVGGLPPSSGSAARFFYCAKASKADRTERGQVANPHPTVKPTDLMRYLCRLVTPPGGHVLDPFAGSGSTIKGGILEGFDVTACEMEEHSAKTAQARAELAVIEYMKTLFP